jgi:hypothetical protein
VVAPDSLEPPMTMTSEPVFAPARLALLLQHFAEINDDRESWRVAYPLKEVLLLVTCATIASCDDFEAIVSWAEHHLTFLRRFSDFHHGVPCALFARCFEERPILISKLAEIPAIIPC